MDAVMKNICLRQTKGFIFLYASTRLNNQDLKYSFINKKD